MDKMNYSTIITETKNGVLTITLNRPEKYNAVTNELWIEFRNALEEARNDDNVRAVVITGAGKAFCAGGDMEGLQSYWGNHIGFYKKLELTTNLSIRTLAKFPKPVICALNGVAAGGEMCIRDSVQALSGAMAMTGEADRPPVKLGVPMADIGGGWHGVVGVLAALVARQTTGKGQMVDISMLDRLVSLHGYEATYYLYSGIVPERLGTGHRTSCLLYTSGRLIRARPQLKVPLKLWLKRLCRFMERFAARRALAYYVNLNFIAVLLYATAILNK